MEKYLSLDEKSELRRSASPFLTKTVEVRSCDLFRLLQELSDTLESLASKERVVEALSDEKTRLQAEVAKLTMELGEAEEDQARLRRQDDMAYARAHGGGVITLRYRGTVGEGAIRASGGTGAGGGKSEG